MKIENGTLVMVADGAKLLLFRNDGDSKYPVLTTLQHEEIADPASRDQGSDAPGHVRQSVGSRSSSYGETDWHDQTEDRFAAHSAQVLEKAMQAEPEAGLVVIAAPRTLGELRKHYGQNTGARLSGEIAKDLAGHSTDDIVEAIAAHRP